MSLQTNCREGAGWGFVPPGLRRLFLHGDFNFYLFAKISLVLLEIFSLYWTDLLAPGGPSSVEQVTCSQIPALLTCCQSHRLCLRHGFALHAVSRDKIRGGLLVSKHTRLSPENRLDSSKCKISDQPPSPQRCVLVWWHHRLLMHWGMVEQWGTVEQQDTGSRAAPALLL